MKQFLRRPGLLSAAAVPLAWAAAGGGALPLPDQPMTVRLSADTIDYGETVRASGSGLGMRTGSTVRLFLFPASGPARQIATTRTDRAGRWSAVLRPPASGRIAGFGPSAGRSAVAAGAGTPITLRTSLRVPAVVTTHGRAPLLRGRAVPAGRVRVQLERRHGRHWRSVASTITAADGNFTFRLRRGESSTLRASTSARPGLAASQARSLRALRLRPAVASWYWLYGSPLACGGRLRRDQLGVAHKTLKCGTRVTVSFRGRTLVVPVVDRGPYIRGREWDLTGALARRLGFTGVQTIWVSP